MSPLNISSQETNNKWLIAQSVVENERAQADKPAKKATDESFIRHASRRGTYNTITFSMVEAMPAILRDTPAPFDPVAHKKSQVRNRTGHSIAPTLLCKTYFYIT